MGLKNVETDAFASRPRAAARARSREKLRARPQYVAPRVDHVVTKSFKSRVAYTLALLNVVVWLPMWLKIISARRIHGAATPVSLFDGHVSMKLEVPSFEPFVIAASAKAASQAAAAGPGGASPTDAEEASSSDDDADASSVSTEDDDWVTGTRVRRAAFVCESRRRRGDDLWIFRGASPRPGRGRSRRRGDAAATTWIFGGASPGTRKVFGREVRFGDNRGDGSSARRLSTEVRL